MDTLSVSWGPDQLPLRSRNRLCLPLGGYADGTRIEIQFTTFVGTSRRPRALVMAGVHGDEYEGPAVLQDLAAEIAPESLRGMLVLVPVANPQAFQAGTRRNPADQGDLNRAFPGAPGGTATERLADLLFREFALGSDCILSLHGWSKEAAVVPYAEYPEGDHEAARESYAAAQVLGLEYVHPYRWPAGVLGDATLKHGIPTVETEVGGMGTVTPEGQAKYRDVVLRFLAHFGLLEFHGPAAPVPRIISHTDLPANYAGLFRSRVSIGQAVETQQILGAVHAAGGDSLEEIRAPRAGIVGILRTFASVQPGDRLVQLFWERAAQGDTDA